MANGISWRQMNLASPAERYWRGPIPTGKGGYGGECYHLTCSIFGATWYNRSSGYYYCDSCAREMNRLCLSMGMPKLCQLHL